MPLLHMGIALLIAQGAHKNYKSREDFRVIGGLTLVARAYCDSATANDVWEALSVDNCPAAKIGHDDTCLFYVAAPFQRKAVQAIEEQSAAKHFKLEIDAEPAAIGNGIRSTFRHGKLFVTNKQLAAVRHAIETREPPTISPFISDKFLTRFSVFTPVFIPGSKPNAESAKGITKEAFFAWVIYTSDTIVTPFGSICADMDSRRRFVRDSARSFHCADGYWDSRISFRSEGGWLKSRAFPPTLNPNRDRLETTGIGHADRTCARSPDDRRAF